MLRAGNGTLEQVRQVGMYQVQYYSTVQSPNRPVHRGGGVWVATFTTLEAAEQFAKQHRVYGKPCVVKQLTE
jgi:hypothetical protein